MFLTCFHTRPDIASDIISRYKRTKGFNVLHPMGFDSFGLPAEQYAIKTGQHPKITTENNIVRFKEQLNRLGLSYDWSREIKTSDSSYYKWTQWIFLKLYNSYFDKEKNKAVNISELNIPETLSEKEKIKFRDNKRLAYIDTIDVNWCEELGTVLANEEVIGGLSERGGYPVIRRPMKQWGMRITDCPVLSPEQGSKLYFFNLDFDGSLIKSSLPVIVYPFNLSAIARLCIAEPPIAIK